MAIWYLKICLLLSYSSFEVLYYSKIAAIKKKKKKNSNNALNQAKQTWHMPFIMESSNQHYTILTPLLLQGSTLYLCFPFNYSISGDKSLHLEHALPESWTTTASPGSSRHDDIPVALKWCDYHLWQKSAVKRWWPPMAEWQLRNEPWYSNILTRAQR